GDTLWDLARSYYKTPWRYMRIAEFNRLKNPDHIVAGTSIEIPSR
ncbi:LysM peptidoglycan-binding domain-containing protein, partial [Treponema paraluiscuniculi]